MMRRLVRLALLVAVAPACEAPGAELLVPLTVVNWYPGGNATCVPRDTGVFVTFSEPLRPESVTADSVQLLDGSAPVSASVGHDPDTATVTLWPDQGLRWQTTYAVRLDPGLRASLGAELGIAVESRFTTQPQLGCLGGLECFGDQDCAPQRCSVTGICVDGCVVLEDCPAGQVCAGGACTP